MNDKFHLKKVNKYYEEQNEIFWFKIFYNNRIKKKK